MIGNLTGWPAVVLVLTVSVLAIPWLYGLASAAVYGYRRYFEIVVELFGVDPWPEPPRTRRDEDPATDGGRREADEP